VVDSYSKQNNKLSDVDKKLFITYFKMDDDFTYKPPIMTEKYQISVWRIDAHVVVKVKFQYFTPQHAKFSSTDFSEFELSTSCDGTTVMLVESDPKVLDKLFVVIDICTLKVLSEQTINLVDEEYKLEVAVPLEKQPSLKVRS